MPVSPTLEEGRRERLAESIASYDVQPGTYAERFAQLDVSQYVSWLFDTIGELPQPRILDVGCGTGRDAETFAAHGARTFGIDLSKEMTAWARRHVTEASFVIGDMLDLPLRAESFDAVWSMASLVHLDLSQTQRVLTEISRVLRPDGLFLASVPRGPEPEWRPDEAGGRRWFRYYRSASEVSRLLRDSAFDILRIDDAPGVVSGRWITALCRKPG